MFPSSNSGRSMAVLWEVASVREVSGGGFFPDAVPSQRPLVLSILQISSPRLGEFSWFFSPMMPMKPFSASSISEKNRCWFQTYHFFRDTLIAFLPLRWRHGRCHNLATGSLASPSSDDTSSKAPQSFSGSAHHDQRLGELDWQYYKYNHIMMGYSS